MITDHDIAESIWEHISKGALRHVSGLTFKISEGTGRFNTRTNISLSVDRNSLEPWQESELLRGTPLMRLCSRFKEIQAEGLAWYYAERHAVLNRGAPADASTSVAVPASIVETSEQNHNKLVGKSLSRGRASEHRASANKSQPY